MTYTNQDSYQSLVSTDTQSDDQTLDRAVLRTSSNQVITEYGKQNMFAAQPPMEYVEDYKGYWVEAERLNGRLAMIGLFAMIHNYAIFGWVIPGIA